MAKLPNIGIVISTPGRASLFRTLRSIQYQGIYRGDDILVVGDGFDQPTHDLVEAFGPPFRYVATRITRDWGHSQLNWGLKNVGGDIVTYQDDDDIYLPRALEEMRRLMRDNPGAPMIGRVKTPNLGLLWSEPGPKTMLDGHCLVAPNDKKKLGYFTSDYHGDQCYISTTIDNYKDLNWVDRVWTLTRPTWKLFPSRSKGPEPYYSNFWNEMVARLPLAAGRPLTGDDDWYWTFYDQSGSREVGHPVAALKMFDDNGRTWAVMSYVSTANCREYIDEIVEFAAWAAQGQELWFGTFFDDDEIIDALKVKGFQDHMLSPKLKRSDYTLAWPPKWFPFRTIYELQGEHGEHVADWRDKWG